MATRDEIVDEIAGFALFADLATPQLERVAHTFEEQVYAEGERVLRQGLSGVGVPRDPRRRGRRRHRRRGAGDARPGRLLRRGLDPARRAARSPTSSRRTSSAASSSPGHRSSRSCSTTRRSCTGCSRRRPAGSGTRTGGGAERPPVPAGRLPGRRRRERAGRRSRSRTALTRLGIDHAVHLGRRGARRHVPALAVLPAAPVVDEAVRAGRRTTSRAYQRYDWNSLLADEPEHQAIMPGLMDGDVVLPVAAGDGAEPRDVRRRGPGSRSATAAAGRRRAARRRPTGDGFVLETTDGEYRSPIVVFAVGVAEPSVPDTPGIELAVHYADTRPAETYADQRVFIIGKQNSGFELASGLLQWARTDRPRLAVAGQAVGQHEVARRRPGALRPAVRGPRPRRRGDDPRRGDRADRAARRRRLRGRSPGRAAAATRCAFEADEVIAATGFVTPLLDLPELGVTTFGQSRLPAQTPYWESASVPGIFFAGTITQGSPGLKKHGLPSNSGAVHGARYNARVLARRIAATRFDAAAALERPADRRRRARRPSSPSALMSRRSCSTSGRTSRGSSRSTRPPARATRGSCRWPRSSTRPAATATGDAIAVTLEADGSGAIYPVVYARRGGRLEEVMFDPDPLLRYDTPAVRARLAELVEAELRRCGSSAA